MKLIISCLLLCSTPSYGWEVRAGNARTNIFKSQHILPALPLVPYKFNSFVTWGEDDSNAVTVIDHGVDWAKVVYRPQDYKIHNTVLWGTSRGFSHDLSGSGYTVGTTIKGVTNQSLLTISSGGYTNRIQLPKEFESTNSLYLEGSFVRVINDDAIRRDLEYGWSPDTRKVWVEAEEGWTAQQLMPNWPAGWPATSHASFVARWQPYIDNWYVDGSWDNNIQRTLIRNTNSILRDVDLSAITSWANRYWMRLACTTVLLSPRIGVCCGHYSSSVGLPVGTEILFIDNQNNVYTNIIKRTTLLDFGTSAGLGDSNFIEFEADVSSNVVPIEVLDPYDSTNYISADIGFCAYRTDQTDIISPLLIAKKSTNNRYVNYDDRPLGGYTTPDSSRYSELLRFWSVVNRDSGTPAIIVVDNKPVLIDLYAGGSFDAMGVDELNQRLYELWGYSNVIKKLDLSRFNKY